jgi:putative hydrolase of the HAD superfamily
VTKITTLYWDIGGVVLTNGWDRANRRRVTESFGVDWEAFDARHGALADALERGRVSLDDYLEETLLSTPQSFTKEEFKEAIFNLSKPNPEVLAIVGRIVRTGRYLIAAINNESLALNLYRIEKYELRRYFDVFFSSCFLGFKKPEPEIYQAAMRMTQAGAEESLFIDDRLPNLKPAEAFGMRTIHYKNPELLLEGLERLGVEVPSD